VSNDDLTTQRLSTYSVTLYAYSSTVGSSVYSFDSRQTRKPGFRKSAVGFHTVVDSCPPVSWNPLRICFLSVAMRHVRCEKCIRKGTLSMPQTLWSDIRRNHWKTAILS